MAVIWIWGTLFVAGFYPLVDGRAQFRAIWLALRRGKEGERGERAAV